MKPTIKKILFATLSALFFVTAAIAQPPPPPNEHGDNQNQPAPIGSGLVLLMAMGVAYGGKKVYDARKRLSD